MSASTPNPIPQVVLSMPDPWMGDDEGWSVTLQSASSGGQMTKGGIVDGKAVKAQTYKRGIIVPQSVTRSAGNMRSTRRKEYGRNRQCTLKGAAVAQRGKAAADPQP